jgi:hypothetical protein
VAQSISWGDQNIYLVATIFGENVANLELQYFSQEKTTAYVKLPKVQSEKVAKFEQRIY